MYARLLLIVVLLSVTAIRTWAQTQTIIYLHGYIIEVDGTQPVHEKFGLYDFNGIVAALESNGATVIADVRSGEIDPGAFYLPRADWLEPLLEWIGDRQ